MTSTRSPTDEAPRPPEPNAIERLAVRFLRSRNVVREPRIHRWTAADLREIRYLEITAIALAAFSGMVSGTLIGGLEVWLNVTIVDTDESWASWFEYWALFLGLSVIVSVAEIIFLYWVVLWRVSRITTIAGLRLSGGELEQVIALGLSRAALDVPDPRQKIHGIDPYLRVPRWKLWGYAALYRLKIGATSFIVRVLLRRVLARATVRALIPMVAIAIYSIWNAIIIHWVMRAARIRAAGPVAVLDVAERVRVAGSALDDDSRRLLIEAVAEAVIRSENDHPNFTLLLNALFDELGTRPEDINLDWASSLESIRRLDADAQSLLLDLVRATVLLDGRPRRKQRRFLEEVYRACGREHDAGELRTAFTQFLKGQGIHAAS